MKHISYRLLALAALLGAGIALFSQDRPTTLAIAGGQYVLDWHVIGFGGGVSSGGAYEVSGTAGQAGADELSGGAYSLGGGFWGGGARVVAPVTSTPTPGAPSPTATPTATATIPAAPTATVTPTPTAPSGDANVQLYLPLVER